MSVITSLCCTSSGESSCCWSTNWTGEFKKFGQSPTTNGNLFICIFLWIAFPLHMTEIHSAAYLLEMGILISAEFWRCIYCWCHEYLFQCTALVIFANSCFISVWLCKQTNCSPCHKGSVHECLCSSAEVPFVSISGQRLIINHCEQGPCNHVLNCYFLINLLLD